MLTNQQLRGLVASGPKFQDKVVLQWGLRRLTLSSIAREKGWLLASAKLKAAADELLAESRKLRGSSVQQLYPQAVTAALA